MVSGPEDGLSFGAWVGFGLSFGLTGRPEVDEVTHRDVAVDVPQP